MAISTTSALNVRPAVLPPARRKPGEDDETAVTPASPVQRATVGGDPTRTLSSQQVASAQAYDGAMAKSRPLAAPASGSVPLGSITRTGADGQTTAYDSASKTMVPFTRPPAAPLVNGTPAPAAQAAKQTLAPTAASTAPSPDGDNEATESSGDQSREGADDMPPTKPSAQPTRPAPYQPSYIPVPRPVNSAPTSPVMPAATQASPVTRPSPYRSVLTPGQPTPPHMQTNPDPTNPLKKKIKQAMADIENRSVFSDKQLKSWK